jgi:hypothetical protein
MANQLTEELLAVAREQPQDCLCVLRRRRDEGSLYSALLTDRPEDALNGVRALLGAACAVWDELRSKDREITWDGPSPEWCEEAALCDLCLAGAARWFADHVQDRVTAAPSAIARVGTEAFRRSMLCKMAAELRPYRSMVPLLPLPRHHDAEKLVPIDPTTASLTKSLIKGADEAASHPPELSCAWKPDAWRRLLECLASGLQLRAGRQLVVPIAEFMPSTPGDGVGAVRYMVVHMLRTAGEEQPAISLGHLASSGADPLSRDLRDSFKDTLSLCNTTLPGAGTGREWRYTAAISIARPQVAAGQQLAGASWSLPLGLALMAGAEDSVPGIASPGDLVATGRLHAGGHIGRVDGVEAKLASIAEWTGWVGAPVGWAMVPTENQEDIPGSVTCYGELAKLHADGWGAASADAPRSGLACVCASSFQDAVAAMPDPWESYLQGLVQQSAASDG